MPQGTCSPGQEKDDVRALWKKIIKLELGELEADELEVNECITIKLKEEL